MAQAQRRQKKQNYGDVSGPIFQVKDLTAGVNLRPTPTTIKPNQSLFLQNTLIANVGELGVYPGWKSFMTTSLGTRRAQGGKRVYLKNGVTFTLVADNGSVYKPSDAGGSAWNAAVSTGWNAANAIDFPNDRDQVAIFDGATVPKKSADGTTWTQLGITAPAALGLAAVAGGSLVNGDVYEVTATYYNSATNQESNESTVATVTPSGANLTIAVTVVASADPQVTHVRLYARDRTAGEASRRQAIQVANANGTTNLTTNNWSSSTVPPGIGMASVAVPMAFGVIWKNRWWGVDATVSNRLRFSQVFANNQWPDTFYVDIPFERGEGIQAMIPLGDILVVFGYTKFYLILGQTSLDFEVRPGLGAQTGALGFRAVDVLENSIVHGGAPGVYVYNGATDQLMTYPIDPAWQAMMGNTTAAELSLLPLTYHKLRKELRVAVPNVFPTGSRGEWILDLNRTNAPAPQGETNDHAWFATDRTIGGYIQFDGAEPNSNNHGRIFSWSPSVVQLFEERTGTSANGSDITMQYQGFMLPLGIQFGRIVETYLEYQPASQSTSFSVSLVVDGMTFGPQSLNIVGSIARWGTFKWGTDTWGSGVTRTMIPITWPLGCEGHSAQLRIKYIGQGSPKFFTYGHNVVEEALPRGI
jgi:hypothetical protein